ncbi:cellulose biosynthesis protein BcsR [Escherichia coli]|nr:cellulose biosynthesis protein BcsR [Escherichia coli]
MNNNEPDTLPDPAIGYIFQNDILALKQAFSLPDIDYADISQREQLAAALKRWPLLAVGRGIKTLAVAGRVCATKVGDW